MKPIAPFTLSLCVLRLLSSSRSKCVAAFGRYDAIPLQSGLAIPVPSGRTHCEARNRQT